MSLLSPPAEQRVVLSNVSWETFEALASDSRHLRGRMAYEEGFLEIMSPSREHEMLKSAIGRLVEAFAQEMGIDMAVTGSTTIQRELKKRGLEPDESYYIQNEAVFRGRIDEDFDLERDPPPDLAIEVEITKSALDKLGIYAALGVAEVWFFDGETLKVHSLDAGGHYAECADSRVLPKLPMPELKRFLKDWKQKSLTRLANEFRAWVRENLVRPPGK